MKDIGTVLSQILGVGASASKVVLLMVSFTICLTFYKGKLTEDRFEKLAGGVLVYYFSTRNPGQGDSSPTPGTATTTMTATTSTPAPITPVAPVVVPPVAQPVVEHVEGQ